MTATDVIRQLASAVGDASELRLILGRIQFAREANEIEPDAGEALISLTDALAVEAKERASKTPAAPRVGSTLPLIPEGEQTLTVRWGERRVQPWDGGVEELSLRLELDGEHQCMFANCRISGGSELAAIAAAFGVDINVVTQRPAELKGLSCTVGVRHKEGKRGTKPFVTRWKPADKQATPAKPKAAKKTKARVVFEQMDAGSDPDDLDVPF
jgi:hypothetical protein